MTHQSVNPEVTFTQVAETDTTTESIQVSQPSLPNVRLNSSDYDLSPHQPPIPGIGFNAIRCAAPAQQVPMNSMGGTQFLMPTSNFVTTTDGVTTQHPATQILSSAFTGTQFVAQNPVAGSLQDLQTMVNGIPQIVFGTPTVPTIKFPVPTLTARPSLVDPDQLIRHRPTHSESRS